MEKKSNFIQNKNDNIHKNEVLKYRIWNPHRISKSKKKKIIQIGPETTKFDFCGLKSHLGKLQHRIENPNQNSKSKKKKLFKSVQKQRNWTVVVRTVILGKYNIEY